MLKKIIVFLLLVFNLVASSVEAQSLTEVGLTGGVARFYPSVVQLGTSNRNNSMSNGSGFSCGVFMQKFYAPKLQQILEINVVNLSSDIFMEKDPEGSWSPYDGSGRKPVYGNFANTSFTSLSASLGVKYYFTKRLFAYPAFVLSRSLNQNVVINKTDYRIKAGLGLNLKKVHVIMEYVYGLRAQNRVLDPTVPFQTTTRTKYLQLKVQVPLLKFK